jgi:hypothetical protein
MSGPDSKKARFNPSGSLPNIPSSASGSSFNGVGSRAYENYGYGNGHGSQGGSALYSTPNNNLGNPNGSLSLGTTNLNLNVANMQQHSPSSPFATSPLAATSANGGNLNGSAANYVSGMNMNGMMNAFGYNGMPTMMGMGNMGNMNMNGMGMAGMNMANLGMQMGFAGMNSGYGMSPQVASFQQVRVLRFPECFFH